MSDNRLKHTPEGYLHAMQMTSAQLLAFVEGENFDEYFYAEICRTMTDDYQIRRAREIPLSDDNKSAGGKKALISWFNYLKQHSALAMNSLEQEKVFVFFLDKDIDDIIKEIIKSPHIIYTKYYCIENHIFTEGNLNKTAAIIASRDSQRMMLGDSAKWRQEVAQQWKSWVKLCLFSRKYKLNCECNYGNLPKKSDNPLYEMLADDIYLQYKEIVKNSSKLTEKQFNQSFGSICKKVDDLYAKGEHDLIFKGKWYAGFFKMAIERVIGTKPSDSDKSCFQITMSTVDFNGKWAEHFKKPLKSLLKKINKFQ
jgi:hypothetical protein